MNKTVILVPKDSINEDGRKKLEDAGIVVVEHSSGMFGYELVQRFDPAPAGLNSSFSYNGFEELMKMGAKGVDIPNSFFRKPGDSETA